MLLVHRISIIVFAIYQKISKDDFNKMPKKLYLIFLILLWMKQVTKLFEFMRKLKTLMEDLLNSLVMIIGKRF